MKSIVLLAVLFSVSQSAHAGSIHLDAGETITVPASNLPTKVSCDGGVPTPPCKPQVSCDTCAGEPGKLGTKSCTVISCDGASVNQYQQSCTAPHVCACSGANLMIDGHDHGYYTYADSCLKALKETPICVQ
jgi:hypothetical protein